ncbi:YncE family protein [Granulicella sp. 5B5]|uniref:YncE family protein n=1 Tax=Granulicella sp. 5B5 TaxID=1617967 RepID=UPI0015F5C018|nr:YncE family protein [Granulicella sp. 5B5]QMV19861.1 YncE family protein [Granulicella sp. 5B5]
MKHRTVAALALASATLGLSACGNQYRPVVSAISPVGPASQPTKYAVAVSNPTSTVDQITGYSIAANVITVYVKTSNPFTAGQVVTLSGLPTSTFLNGQNLTVLSTGLSTTQFEASFTYVNTAATETGFAALSGSLPGLVTFVDFSGDTVVDTPNILANPSYFALNNTGTEAFAINTDGSLNDFATSNPASLLTSNVVATTLTANSAPVSISAITPANGTASIFIPQTNSSSVAVLSVASTSLLQTLSVGANPVYVVGADGTPRVYAISQGTSGNGQVAAIEATSSSSLGISTTIPVGATPVYGVMTADTRRAFILNKGSNTVSVINVVNNALDSTTPTINLGAAASNGAVAAPDPVWADLSPTTNQLVVLNQGDGTHAGTLSIIDIPLCTASTQTANPQCNANNPVDGNTFGTITNTVNVGINPQMVSVLRDGTAAYVANQLDSTGTCAAGEGSVSVVSLISGTVTATICATSSSAATIGDNTSPSLVYGHPSTISATTGDPTGKVYVTSPDNQYMTIIYTDSNTVQGHINLQGLGVRVLTTLP